MYSLPKKKRSKFLIKTCHTQVNCGHFNVEIGGLCLLKGRSARQGFGKLVN